MVLEEGEDIVTMSTNANMIKFDFSYFGPALVSAVQNGSVSEARIDVCLLYKTRFSHIKEVNMFHTL